MDARPQQQNPWVRIDAWLRAQAPRTWRALAPPLDDDGVAAFARAVGHALPASLCEAYRAHDGARGESTTILSALRTPQPERWALSMWWLSAERAVRSLRFMQTLGWPAALLPIAEDGGGNLLAVDLDSGAVSVWDHEDGSTIELAPDLHAWMTGLADDMEAGLVCPEDEEGDRLIRLAAPPPPPPAPPKLPRDRPARVLLALLIERQLIAVEKGANLTPFLKRLTSALTTKAIAARCTRVIALLTESDVIEEIFARDEELVTLIEDLG